MQICGLHVPSILPPVNAEQRKYIHWVPNNHYLRPSTSFLFSGIGQDLSWDEKWDQFSWCQGSLKVENKRVSIHLLLNWMTYDTQIEFSYIMIQAMYMYWKWSLIYCCIISVQNHHTPQLHQYTEFEPPTLEKESILTWQFRPRVIYVKSWHVLKIGWGSYNTLIYNSTSPKLYPIFRCSYNDQPYNRQKQNSNNSKSLDGVVNQTKSRPIVERKETTTMVDPLSLMHKHVLHPVLKHTYVSPDPLIFLGKWMKGHDSNTR